MKKEYPKLFDALSSTVTPFRDVGATPFIGGFDARSYWPLLWYGNISYRGTVTECIEFL